MTRAALAGVATVAIMGTYEALYAGWWFGSMDPAFAALFRWVSLALATPVTLWSAAPFFAGAWNGLRHRVLHMDLPIALGIAVLYVHGVVATVTAGEGYLDSLVMLVALLLVGRMLEARGRRRASEAATALVATIPRTARRSVGDRSRSRISSQAIRSTSAPVRSSQPTASSRRGAARSACRSSRARRSRSRSVRAAASSRAPYSSTVRSPSG
jgi:cation transport ATPase